MAGIDQKTLWDFARIVLKGVGDKQQAQSVRAKFLRTDPDGTQWVQLDGSSEETPVNGRTFASAQAGDTVELEISDGVLSLDGNASEPSVGMRSAKKVANEAAEGARRMAADAGRAAELSKQIADAAQQVANAVNQHFFTDTSGIHVTAATQDDWNSNHTGANVLINALGQLFRDGLNNLLTLTTENGARALTIWDGLGNAAGNVRAIIGETIQLGKSSDKHIIIDSDSIDMCDESGVLWSMTSDSNGAPHITTENNGYYVGSYVAGDGTEAPRHSHIHGLTGFLQDFGDGASAYVSASAQHSSALKDAEILLFSPASGNQVSSDSKLYVRADALLLSGASASSGWLSMAHVIAMLTTDSATLTRGSAVSSWSSGTIRKSGKVVTMTINGAKLASALSSGSTSGTITTIPTGYRPADNLQRGVACIATTGNYANVWFVVSTTGNVAIANRSSLQIPTTAEINMQITYIID